MNVLDGYDATKRGDLVIFDGVCNLCEASVNFIIHHDKNGIFRFVPSQSEFGNILQQRYALTIASLDTIVLIHNGEVFTESEAAVRIASSLDGRWRLLGLARLIPRLVRDWLYRRIVNNRYAWFGRKDVCLIPTLEVRGRFLESYSDLRAHLLAESEWY